MLRSLICKNIAITSTLGRWLPSVTKKSPILEPSTLLLCTLQYQAKGTLLSHKENIKKQNPNYWDVAVKTNYLKLITFLPLILSSTSEKFLLSMSLKSERFKRIDLVIERFIKYASKSEVDSLIVGEFFATMKSLRFFRYVKYKFLASTLTPFVRWMLAQGAVQAS